MTYSDKTIVLCVVFLMLVVGALGYAMVKQHAYEERQHSYMYCMETEMGEGHTEDLSDTRDSITWHGPNLMPRLGHANQVCNAKFKEAYGIDIQDNTVFP